MRNTFFTHDQENGGYARSYDPFVRFIGAACTLAVVLGADPNTYIGLGLMSATVAAWLLCTRPSRRALRRSIAFSVMMFSPVFLFAFFNPPPGITSEMLPLAWAVPWKIFVRSTASLLCLTAAWTTFNLAELEDALNHLPVPRAAIVLTVQILHQARLLIDETERVGQALALRTGAKHFTFSLARGLASGWLIRILFKADRITTAMEVRGYEPGSLIDPPNALGRRNLLAIAVSLIWLACVVFLQETVRP